MISLRQILDRSARAVRSGPTDKRRNTLLSAPPDLFDLPDTPPNPESIEAPGLKQVIKSVLERVLAPLPQPRAAVSAKPGLHLRWRVGWVKGWAVRPVWRVREWLGGPRIRVGRRFSLRGELWAKGKGTVIFGDDVIVDDLVTPFTHSKDAVIRIGDRAFVNGTRFGCSTRIEIGDDAILADARILDTDFHPVSRLRSKDPNLPIATAPVRVGNNVWIAGGSAVLKGVTVGDNSVVAFGSVVVKDVPADTIAGGNPARPLGPVPD